MPASLTGRLGDPEGPIPVNDFGKLWKDALQRYKEETDRDLLELPIGKTFPPSPSSADEIMRCFEKQNESFKAFRTRGEKIRRVLRPIVDIVLVFKECVGDVSHSVPGSEVIFGAIGVLLQTTKGVSGLYDSVEALLQEVIVYLKRVTIHLKPKVPPAPEVMNVLADALVQVFTALAMATKYCNLAVKSDSRLRSLMRVSFRRSKDYFLVLADQADVKAVLERLQNLAVREAQIIGADTNAIVRESEYFTACRPSTNIPLL
ncbi:hypothetical protein PENSPDRAFT_739236 [Peniophora sp. CONT]|nr:hypothetical protein PENSPDRAFT_739236 [Peniophora sp. CONT]